jgi:hypothetical protein
MPTLIRLIVALLFLGGLGYGALFALTIFVDPGVKEITVKIPARDLAINPNANSSAPPKPLVTSAPAETPLPTDQAPIAPGANKDAPE